MSTAMTLSRIRSFYRIAARVRDLAQDQRGVSAVEFALLLPFMVAIYLGSVELSQGIATDRKVTLAAHTVSDLISQVSSINNSDMNNTLNAGVAVMAPNPRVNLTVVVSSVDIDAKGQATVVWSDAFNGTARRPNARVAIPPALAVPNTTLIWSEVSYRYSPAIGHLLTGILTLQDQSFMRPRLSHDVRRI